MRFRNRSPHWRFFSGAFCLTAFVALALPVRGQDGGGVLHANTTRVRGFDPARAGDVASSLAVGKVYEGLLEYAYRERPYRLAPCLARAMPTVSDDGLTYTFELRRGVMFHPDDCFAAAANSPAQRTRELIAEDVVYSLKRVADIKTGSSGYWAFRDRIAGLDAFREASSGASATDYARPVEGLEVVDTHTVRFRLVRPYPQLLWILAMPYAYVVPREAVQAYGADFVQHPVGTGPFALKAWRRNYRIEYVRNPLWSPRGPEDVQAVGPGAGVRVDRIVQYVIGDPTTRWLSFLSGDLDLYGEISRDNWDAVMDRDGELSGALRARGIRLYTMSGLNVFFIGFNMDDPVVGKNRALRQALSCAFNTEEWVRFHNGRIVRARGPIPPGVDGYDEAPAPFGFDLEQARRLLAEGGYPEGRDPGTGRRLALDIELGATDADFRESTELFIAFMDRIGVVVRPHYNNKPAFFAKIERRQAQLFRLSWFADYPDAENFLQLFYSANASPGPNRSNYSNPAYDALYERARVMQDGPERTVLYRRMAELVKQDCPWIFMHHPVDFSLTQEWVREYLPHDFPYGMEKYYRLTRSHLRPTSRVEKPLD